MTKTLSPQLPTVLDLVNQKNLTFTDICTRTGLNQRTVKHRLEFPWLFNVVELGRVAKLLEMTSAALFDLVMTLAEARGELSPDKLPTGRKAGRPPRAKSADAAPVE